MPTFCTAGQTARVTFPDGSIQDFTDSPIEVTVTPKYSSTNCASLRITVEFEVASANNIYVNGVWKGYGYEAVWTLYQFFVYNPFNGLLFKDKSQAVFDGRTFYKKLFTICRGFEVTPYICRTLGEYQNSSNHAGFSGNYRNLKVYKGSVQLSPASYQITVTNSSSVQLFSQSFSSDNYSVSCIATCPPNSLDCGDCCLDCASIFNGLSAIRKIIAGLK